MGNTRVRSVRGARSLCGALAVMVACGAPAPQPAPPAEPAGATPGAAPAATPAATPVEAGPTSSGLDAVSQRLLDAHNRVRAEHCAEPLEWSAKLAASALAWANRLRDDGCSFAHSSTTYGENLAAGTSGSLDADKVVDMWYREVAAYSFKEGRFSMEAGHFTQVVWKATRNLGCGRSTCGGLDIWVCQYDPPGNVTGAFSRNVVPTSCR